MHSCVRIRPFKEHVLDDGLYVLLGGIHQSNLSFYSYEGFGGTYSFFMHDDI